MRRSDDVPSDRAPSDPPGASSGPRRSSSSTSVAAKRRRHLRPHELEEEDAGQARGALATRRSVDGPSDGVPIDRAGASTGPPCSSSLTTGADTPHHLDAAESLMRIHEAGAGIFSPSVGAGPSTSTSTAVPSQTEAPGPPLRALFFSPDDGGRGDAAVPGCTPPGTESDRGGILPTAGEATGSSASLGFLPVGTVLPSGTDAGWGCSLVCLCGIIVL